MPQTTHQPAGEYPHPSPAHHLNLDEVATQLLSRLPGQGRQTRNIARESGVSLLVMALEEGNTLPEHSADGVVLVQVLRGHTCLEAAGQSLDLRPGQVLMFQPGVRHDIRAVEQSVVLLTITGGS